MARFRLTRNTFNTGVINKDIEQLEDFDMYNNALEECQNFIVNKTGGVYKRPGSLFAADITDLNIPPGRERIFTWYVDPNTRFWIIPSLENVYEMDIEGNPIKDDEGNPISTAYKNVKLNFYNTEGLVEGIKPFLLKHGGKYSTFGKFNFNYEENEYWKKNLEGKALTINITDFKIFHGISDCVFVDRSSYGEESFFFAVGPTYFHYPISVDELSINPMRFMFATAPARSNTKFTAHDVFLTNIQVYEPLMGTDFVKPGIRAVATNNDIIMMVGNAYQYSLHLDDSHYDCVYAYTTAGNKDGTPKYGVINIGPYYNVILYGIAYGAGKFVACGSDGSITGIILVCDVPTSLENWTPNWRVVWTHTTATYVWNKRIKYIN